jgi:hypothetical protein
MGWDRASDAERAEVSEAFFQSPILNSPYEEPARHWELDTNGQPTSVILPRRRPSALISPIPKPRKVRGKSLLQPDLLTDERGEEYNPTEVINGVIFVLAQAFGLEPAARVAAAVAAAEPLGDDTLKAHRSDRIEKLSRVAGEMFAEMDRTMRLVRAKEPSQ